MAKNQIKPEEYFRLCNGEVIKDLSELYKKLKSINNEVFRYHVNFEKNDFSNWIRDVFKDKELASAIQKMYNKERMANFLKKKLDEEEMELMLNNLKMIEHSKKINGDLYPRSRILANLRRLFYE